MFVLRLKILPNDRACPSQRGQKREKVHEKTPILVSCIERERERERERESMLLLNYKHYLTTTSLTTACVLCVFMCVRLLETHVDQTSMTPESCIHILSLCSQAVRIIYMHRSCQYSLHQHCIDALLNSSSSFFNTCSCLNFEWYWTQL